MGATAKIINLPKLLSKSTILQGNPSIPESAEHIIVFPGGSLSVCRTTKNEYWVHIEVNDKQIIDDTTRESKQGQIVSVRLDYNNPPGDVRTIDVDKLNHVAIRIKTI